LLAAVVTAVAAIIAAIVTGIVTSGDESKDEGPAADARPVAIDIVTEVASDPDSTTMRISGTANDVSERDVIFVVARPSEAPEPTTSPVPDEEPARWLASDPADRPTEETWTADLQVPADTDRPLSYSAVVVSGCPANVRCDIDLETLYYNLQYRGPSAFEQRSKEFLER
jgi:hypothetical protein